MGRDLFRGESREVIVIHAGEKVLDDSPVDPGTERFDRLLQLRAGHINASSNVIVAETMSSPDLKDLLLAPRLDPGQVNVFLRPYGIKDPRKADLNLQAMADDPSAP